MKKGFTLIELLVVIVILAILTLFSLPFSLSYISSQRLNASGNEFVELLKTARNRAISERNVSLITISDDGRYTYSMFKWSTNDPYNPWSKFETNASGRRIWDQKWRWMRLKEGVRWNNVEQSVDIAERPTLELLPPNTSNYFIFLPDGSVDYKGKIFELVDRSNSNNIYKIVVVKETGTVKVERKR